MRCIGGSRVLFCVYSGSQEAEAPLMYHVLVSIRIRTLLRRVTTKTILFAELLPEERTATYCPDSIWTQKPLPSILVYDPFHFIQQRPISVDALFILNSLEVVIGREADGADTLHAR